jgi:hypothetical protein
MEDTCIGEKCWLYQLIKEFLGSGKVSPDIAGCPFFMETIWNPISADGSASAKVLKDCVNKRGMLTLLVDIYPRLTGVQKSNEEMRNQTQAAVNVFEKLMNAAARKNIDSAEVINIGE